MTTAFVLGYKEGGAKIEPYTIIIMKGSLIYIHCGCVLCILPRVTRLPIAFVLDLRHDRHGYA
jgi:cbb3-type cytochrome oxidase cytochrome c subunit